MIKIIFDQHWRLILGPVLALATLVLLKHGSDMGHTAILTASITVLCACWWVLEPIPIPATSIIPIALLPLFSILTPSQVAEAYGSPIILLLMGGFILSKALEKSGAHKLIAMSLLRLFGGDSSKKIILGFMVTAATLSMWISNTATTLMLLPVALAVIQSCNNRALALPLLLGICYSASIGGMGTPIGTPPNLILMRVYEENVGEGISFVRWMSWSLPVILLFIPIVWLWLCRSAPKLNGGFELPEKSSWTIEQRRIIWVFAFTALAWITRTEPFGGWRTWLDLPKANDASIALLAVVAMFIVPNGRGEKLLDWESAAKIPWGMLLLFSGGIALAKAFVVSGLADSLAQGLAHLTTLHVILMTFLICLGVTFLTEVTSNTASTSLLMPVLVVAAMHADVDPLLLMVPAALSASCAFMLPVATAPNAIVFGTGEIPITKMVRHGLVLNIVGAVIISFVLSIYNL